MNSIIKDTFGDFLIRLLTKSLTIVTLMILCITILVMHIGEQQILKLGKALGIKEEETYTLYTERIPFEEEIERYIDRLPLPTIEYQSLEMVEQVSESFESIKVETNEQIEETDIMLLAKIMHAEEGVLRSRLSIEDAKRAHLLCGSVVLHRRNMNYLGAKTIKEVIYTPNQYASLEKLNQEVPEETIEWARELIKNGPIGPSDMIYQAEFQQGGSTYDHIDNQYFCCLSNPNE